MSVHPQSKKSVFLVGAIVAGILSSLSAATLATSRDSAPNSDYAVKRYWTPERRRTAIPRDFVVDSRNLTYIRNIDGSWQPHGHSVPAQLGMGTPEQMAKPGSSTDITGPTVTNMSPVTGSTIGSTQIFSATVTDTSGVKSVTFRITKSGGVPQSFTGTASGSTWSVTLQGFTNGSWSWDIIATDRVIGGGNSTTSASLSFTVNTSGGGGGGGYNIVVNERWTSGGAVLNAAGRIYFEMPTNKRLTHWSRYVCSGTVATDSTTGRSIIITAAHCVYDDVNKAFARNVMFIPNQDGTTGSGTDRDCTNDPLGCWTTAFGIVDSNWSGQSWPNNIPWDYGYYVVNDSVGTYGILDVAAGSLTVNFSAPTVGNYTHAMGYSYSNDPYFMYCAENLGEVDANNWWLGSCGLSGGASGGPWIQPLSSGSGPIVSVNSWGYSGSPGMAGPKLSGTSASCLFGSAKSALLSTLSGLSVTC